MTRIANLVGVLAIHLGAVLGVLAMTRTGSWRLLALAAISFGVRMFVITAAYHRYFAHRSFKTSRVAQLVFALIGITCAQKGPLWWASIHRAHHKLSDRAGDPHSPRLVGFWGAHMGWWMRDAHEAVREELVPDLLRYPELRIIERVHPLGSLALVTALALSAGWEGVLVGYCLATCVLHHVVFCINSVTHLVGSRPYETNDDSRNVPWLGIVAFGEGWHNNHHAFPASARLGGHRPWEIDLGWWGLRALAAAGIVWDLRTPTKRRRPRA